jgi:hypothetical protein
MKTTPTAIEKSIIRKLPVEGGSEDAWYNFKCQVTDREFEIYLYDSNYFLDELRPSLIWDDEKKEQTLRSLIRELYDQVTPNEYRQRLQQELLSRENIHDPSEQRYMLIRTGWRDGKPVYLKSLKECAEKICQALNDNAYYVSWTPRVETKEDKIAEIRHSIAYWKGILEATSSVDTASVFNGTSNLLGEKLSKDTKNALLSYFNAPTKALWDELAGNYIAGGVTLWQAWLAIDASAPRSKPEHAEWPSIPSGELLRQAIIENVKSSRQRAEDKLSTYNALLADMTKESKPDLKLVIENTEDDHQSHGMS